MVLDSCMMQLRHLRAGNKLVCTSYFLPLEHRSRGPTDKASDYESEDCGFESHRDHFCQDFARRMFLVQDCFHKRKNYRCE